MKLYEFRGNLRPGGAEDDDEGGDHSSHSDGDDGDEQKWQGDVG